MLTSSQIPTSTTSFRPQQRRALRPELGLAKASHEELLFVGRVATGPVLLLAPLFVALGLIILVDSPMTLVRASTAAAMFAIGAVWVERAWPRRRFVRISLREACVTWSFGSRPLRAVEAFALSANSGRGRGFEHSYQAELVFGDGTRLTFIERGDPSSVLIDLMRTRESLPLPIELAWGLPEQATFFDAPVAARSAPRHAASMIRAPVDPGQPAVSVAVAISGALMGCLIVSMYVTRLRRDQDVSPLSMILAGIAVAIALFLSLAIRTRSVLVSFDRDLVVEQKLLGLTLRSQRIPMVSIRGAYAVGSDGLLPRHVLLDTDQGLLAFACGGPAAHQVAALVSPHTPAAANSPGSVPNA